MELIYPRGMEVGLIFFAGLAPAISLGKTVIAEALESFKRVQRRQKGDEGALRPRRRRRARRRRHRARRIR